jgi:ATP-dependent helicase HepA
LSAWKPGDRLIHRFNPELGPGLVRSVEGRTVEVEFPKARTTLRLAAGSDALEPLVFRVGSRAHLLASGETVLVEGLPSPGIVRLGDGRQVEDRDLWPVDVGGALSERLAQGEIDPLAEVSLRLDALHLAALREADGLGSFLGGRIMLFPHQLHAAETATRSDPVRWLLADEVGLGKTVEACLILNHLMRTGRADRTLIVAPDTLTVQWLGELWRKYHQVFVLLDDRRLADVERDYGRGFNPFDAHHRVVLGIERLRDKPRLTEHAVEAGIDLLIVDEAHHLRRPPGHPGNADYRAVQPIAALGRHLLLLTATPLEDDVRGYFRLLQLLRPEEFPEDGDFEERLRQQRPLPPCVSATRRQDIGGLPPRVAAPVDLPVDADWAGQSRLEAAVRALPAEGTIARRRKARLIRHALASGPAVEALLDPRDEETRQLARRAGRGDPRVSWLTRQALRWKQRGDKTLVFVAHRETLEALKAAMSRLAQTRVGIFHEDLSPGQRDIEVAQFRLPGGPSMLVSTECGGEGRNFQFCTRLVLFDLPWNPMAVEQRIGRLDRIGRELPVEIVYFRPPSGLGTAIVELYEAIGLFREPLAALERELSGAVEAIEELALSGGERLDPERSAAIVEETQAGYRRIKQGAYHQLHRDPYRPAMAESILARIPAELEELTKETVLTACEQLSFHIEDHRDGTRHSIEFGTHARVPSLPGVPGGASFLGTFDREAAVEDESIDFFASGHPLVEGILAHLDDSPMGRVTLLHARARSEGETGFGLVAIYRTGPLFEAVAVDSEGRERPEWAELLTRRPLRSRRVKPETWTEQPAWPDLIRALATRLEHRGHPIALAALQVTP